MSEPPRAPGSGCATWVARGCGSLIALLTLLLIVAAALVLASPATPDASRSEQLGVILMWLIVTIFAFGPTAYFLYGLAVVRTTGRWPGLRSFMGVARVALIAIWLLALLAIYLTGIGQISGPLF